MALWKLSELNPILAYRDCAQYPCRWAGTMIHGDLFCVDSLYAERLSRLVKGGGQFFYYPQEDSYYFGYYFDACWLPGWATGYYMGYKFAAGNLNAPPEMIAAELGMFLVPLYGTLSLGLEVGSYGKIYCTGTFLNFGAVGEVDPITHLPVDGGWFIRYDKLPNCPGSTGVPPTHSIVNREDGILMLAITGSVEMHFWDISSPPYTYIGKMVAPGVVADVSYEDRQRFWVVTKNGYVQKINYHLRRTELLSQLTDVANDLNYRIAWDQKRFRVAIFRHRPENPDGSCASIIELYRPLPKAALLTDPVPIRPLRYGRHIPFSFHLLGTAGEGISPYMVEAELAAPVDGALARASMGTGQYGIGGVEYIAPNLACEETLQLQATIQDGYTVEEEEWLAPRY